MGSVDRWLATSSFAACALGALSGGCGGATGTQADVADGAASDAAGDSSGAGGGADATASESGSTSSSGAPADSGSTDATLDATGASSGGADATRETGDSADSGGAANATDATAAPDTASTDAFAVASEASSGGSDGGVDAAGDVDAAPCARYLCNGNAVQTCTCDDICGVPLPCGHQSCVSGQCIGVCAPGETQCSGNGVQTCDVTGSWGTAIACGCGCFAGACSAACTPGAARCTDAGVQTCTEACVWPTAWSCATASCTGGACAGATATGASCAAGGPGLSDCGAMSESCCTSLEVPGGTFFRGYYPDGDGGALNESAPATISGFRLDKYPVTVGRFRQFVDAVRPADGGAGWLPPPGSGKHAHLNGGLGLVDTSAPADAGVVYEPGWVASDDADITVIATPLAQMCDATDATWTPTPGSQEKLPINCVNWYEAYAFCIWDGGFLPSEAEYTYAVAGGSQQREFPWGLAAPGTANAYAIYGCDYPDGSGTCTGVANIAPVGTATLGAGLWGQLDLSGEVWEWNLDHVPTAFGVCVDCAALSGTSMRYVWGSWFDNPLADLAYPNAGDAQPTQSSGNGGFRCARTP
jgi:formylglycine-generating enzyme required for sulfatase activity